MNRDHDFPYIKIAFAQKHIWCRGHTDHSEEGGSEAVLFHFFTRFHSFQQHSTPTPASFSRFRTVLF